MSYTYLINYEQATAKVKSSEGTQLKQTSRARVYDLAHVLVSSSCDFYLREFVHRICPRFLLLVRCEPNGSDERTEQNQRDDDGSRSHLGGSIFSSADTCPLLPLPITCQTCLVLPHRSVHGLPPHLRRRRLCERCGVAVPRRRRCSTSCTPPPQASQRRRIA